MSLEKVDIKEVLQGAADGKLQVINLARKNTSWLEQQVEHLECNGGDVESALSDLYQIEMELSSPENILLAKRWNKAIAINKKIRMRLITNKALRVLEDYQNLSPTSSASDISYARAVLFMCNTDREKDVDRKGKEEEDVYDEVEKSMERE